MENNTFEQNMQIFDMESSRQKEMVERKILESQLEMNKSLVKVLFYKKIAFVAFLIFAFLLGFALGHL